MTAHLPIPSREFVRHGVEGGGADHSRWRQAARGARVAGARSTRHARQRHRPGQRWPAAGRLIGALVGARTPPPRTRPRFTPPRAGASAVRDQTRDGQDGAASDQARPRVPQRPYRSMRGFKMLHAVQTDCSGHGFGRDLRGGFYKLELIMADPHHSQGLRVMGAWEEITQ